MLMTIQRPSAMPGATDNTISEALKAATQILSTCQPTARIDAEVMLCYVLNKSRTFLHTWPEQQLSPHQQRLFKRLVSRRAEGEPVAYLIGQREFWSLPLTVTPDTLIPRPETELLVEKSLELIPENSQLNIADLGTGSGAIALAIASERPDCKVTAIDNSLAALNVATENAAQLKITNINFLHNDWLQNSEQYPFDIIISNPPYIRNDDPHLNQGDLPFEPLTALASGVDGMTDIKKIAQQAWLQLKDKGWLLLEHGFDQQATVSEILRQQGYQNIEGFRDLSDNDRVTRARKVL